MSWVENKLNLTSTYYGVASSEGDSLEYIIPFPPGYTTAMKAYWTTDIIVLNASCSWQAVRTAEFNSGFSSWNVKLSEANLSLTVYNSTFGIFFLCCCCPSYIHPCLASIPLLGSMASVPSLFSNKSNPVTDGSTGFVLYQLNENGSLPPFMNLSNVPTLQLSNKYTLAFLVCSPHAYIQTYEVRTSGNGIINLGQPQRTQGNLDLDQINYLLSFVLRNFGTSSGPQIYDWADMMIQLLFGDNFVPQNNCPPAPLANITAVYKQVIQSAMKTVLSGAVAKANVPGGSTVERVVFKSSSGHVITSTILFALLTLALVAAQFRTGREAFTLIDVAAALEDSDVPRMCGEMKQLAGVGDRKILTLVWNDDGGLNILARMSNKA